MRTTSDNDRDPEREPRFRLDIRLPYRGDDPSGLQRLNAARSTLRRCGFDVLSIDYGMQKSLEKPEVKPADPVITGSGKAGQPAAATGTVKS